MAFAAVFSSVHTPKMSSQITSAEFAMPLQALPDAEILLLLTNVAFIFKLRRYSWAHRHRRRRRPPSGSALLRRRHRAATSRWKRWHRRSPRCPRRREEGLGECQPSQWAFRTIVGRSLLLLRTALYIIVGMGTSQPRSGQFAYKRGLEDRGLSLEATLLRENYIRASETSLACQPCASWCPSGLPWRHGSRRATAGHLPNRHSSYIPSATSAARVQATAVAATAGPLHECRCSIYYRGSSVITPVQYYQGRAA